MARAQRGTTAARTTARYGAPNETAAPRVVRAPNIETMPRSQRAEKIESMN